MMKSKHPKEIKPKAAFELLDKEPRSLLVDIRSGMEYLFVGHPAHAVNIPWIDEPDWVVDPAFTSHIRKLLLGGVSCAAEGECVPIVLVCRSGKRSMEAGSKLLEEGLSNIYSVDGGFEGELDESHKRNPLMAGALKGCRGHNVRKASNIRPGVNIRPRLRPL